MTQFVAVTPLTSVREQAALDIIFGLGETAEAALADAKSQAPEWEFDVIPCTDRLAAYVDVYGADERTVWTRGSRYTAMADLVDDEIDEE